ncbi:fibronectin type III domain-containing protein [Halioglobus sp. Uisw_031]|uniref:fibronectin type III domain-containing protein n=1 Tax=Halioglobus sp. Uisw_031 TaxID=3230977 RepID=UPI0039E9423B
MITGYTAYCFGDTLAFGESPTSPITVSGLTNGEAYECLVTATNAAGTSLASAASAPFTPAVPPDAPQITGIMAGNEQAIITFTPGADGGSPITGYTAYCYGDTLAFGESPTSPITVFGLTNGQAYVCATTATNDFGASPASAFAPVTPVAPPPGC